MPPGILELQEEVRFLRRERGKDLKHIEELHVTMHQLIADNARMEGVIADQKQALDRMESVVMHLRILGQIAEATTQ